MATYNECGESAKRIFIKEAQENGRLHTFSSLRLAIGKEGHKVSVRTLSKWADDDEWPRRRDEHLESKRQVEDLDSRIEGIEERLLKETLAIRDGIKQKLDEGSAYIDPDLIKVFTKLNDQAAKFAAAIRAKKPKEKKKTKKPGGLSAARVRNIKEKFFGVKSSSAKPR